MFKLNLNLFIIISLWQVYGSAKNIVKPQKKRSSAENSILQLGERKIIPHLNGKSIWVENGKVIKVSAVSNGIEIKGLKEGSSLLRIGNQLQQFQIMQPENFSLWNRMAEKSQSMVGLRIQVVQGIPCVFGKLYQIKDWLTFHDLTNLDSSFEIHAQLSHEIQKQMQDTISNLLAQSHLPPQNLIVSDSLEVRIRRGGENNLRLKKLLSTYGIRVIEENQSIDVEPLVKIEITVAEVIRDHSSKLGIQWPTEISAQTITGPLAFEKSLRVIAEFFESHGAGRVLASPNILCRTGKEAEFLAGGEFPIKVGGTLRKPAEVIWKKYGVLLKVKPVADRSGRMSIGIDTEVSHMDPSHSVDGVPGILTNKMSSHFDLKKPRIIALSGLLKNSEGEESTGIWGLSKIPILGSLFSSRNFLNNRSELIIFVRPSIVDENLDEQPKETSESADDPRHLQEVI